MTRNEKRPPLDSRLTPARGDIAAAHLRGMVEAERFVEGADRRVSAPAAALHRLPDTAAPMETQLLMGETFCVYNTADGWSWGQAGDGYVGYVPAAMLEDDTTEPTHRITVPMTFVYAEPDIKAPVLHALTLGSYVTVGVSHRPFSEIHGGGYVAFDHLALCDHRVGDFVSVMEACLGAPYLWGGRGAPGFDCSGLLQVALQQAGVSCPRDSDMQRNLGRSVTDSAPRRRGDLIFWNGHVGAMRDGASLIHANAFHLHTMVEPLEDAITRLTAAGEAVIDIRRLP